MEVLKCPKNQRAHDHQGCATCGKMQHVCCGMRDETPEGWEYGPFCADCCPGKKTDHGRWWRRDFKGTIQMEEVDYQQEMLLLDGEYFDDLFREYDGKRVLISIQVVPVEACVICKTGGSEWLDLLKKEED